MLDAHELSLRLIAAMDTASPPVKSATLAAACGVTAQAVNGWRKNGRVAKKHIPRIAVETGKPLEYFLGSEPGSVTASHGLTLSLEEALMITSLRDALPNWRRYVVSLARLDKSKQQSLLDTFSEAVPDAYVREKFGDAPHVAARKDGES